MIAAGEHTKRRKYAALCLTPAAWGHLGRAGDDVITFVHGLCRDADPAARSQAITSIWQDVACIIQQRNALILSTGGPLCPP